MKGMGGLILLILSCNLTKAQDSLRLTAPSGRISVVIWKDEELQYLVRFDGREIVGASRINFELDNARSLSNAGRFRADKTVSRLDTIVSPVPEKRRLIIDHYRELTLRFRQPFTVTFRAYDDGVAYQIATGFRDSITVINETASFAFKGNPGLYFPVMGKRENADRFHTSFEEPYRRIGLDTLHDSSLAYTPILVAPQVHPKIAVTESDLEDYPGMFLAKGGKDALRGVFAGYPLEEAVAPGEFPQRVVKERAAYIARTVGKRSFPWRILVIGKEDKDLASTDIVYRLAAPSRIGDASWIKPGKGTDEWIIGINLFNVPFRAGINTATYKYYIDFAKRFGLQRIMLDAGWSDNNDLFRINPALNMDSLADYAREKGVKLSMWTLAMTLDRQLDSALARFKKWGVDFVMTDFIDRDDQQAVRFYHRMSKAFADQQIMLMFHGAYPIKGLHRTYPNVVSTEGVLGSEYNIWSDKANPPHDLALPFTRMLSGPMDYEPGLLNNATAKGFRANHEQVMSMGTRCHQLAMFVVYDNTVPIFSGNPSQALQEPAFMELLSSIPTTWDETRVLEAAVGEYIVTARKKGKDWYIAGMNDWKERDMAIPLEFLEEGNYRAEICRDGVNADRYPADYELVTQATMKRNTPLRVHLAPGGGFLVKLIKQ